jgi:PAS domain S-box-containing protein
MGSFLAAPRTKSPRASLFEYGLAIAAVAAVSVLRLPAERFLQGRAPYALYYLAVLVTAWFCGAAPTILAVLLSLASAWAFIVPGTEPGSKATIPVFLIVCGTMVLMARAVRRIQETAAYMSAVVESSDDAVVTKDLQGVIRSWNAGAARIFEYSAPEVVGRPVALLIPPEHQHEEAVILERLRRGERVDHFETVRLAKGGRRVDVSLTISPIRDRFGVVIGASKVARDITERKRAADALAAQREWLDRTLQSIGDAVIAADARGRISFMNPVAERLTGWSSAAAHGRDSTEVFRIVNEGTRKMVESPVARVLREGMVTGLANSTILLAADGTERPIDDSGAPIFGRDGQIIGVVMVFRDISERRRAEAERSAASVEREQLLERERAARSEAESASRSKDEFIATVSHELRTPLNAILGWSHILEDGADADTTRRAVQVIARNARSQAQLISDLLDMSRVISGKLRLDVHDIDLIAVIRTAIETVKPAADAKGISIESTFDPSLAATTGDAGRLQQCVWNLLSNAIKFTPQGGGVTVTLRRSDSHVEIAVSDTGMGIRSGFLPFVFERFRQGEPADGATERPGGLGLGLAIAKELVELHGGRIRAESPGEGQGSTFTIALPVRALRAAPAPARVEPGRRVALSGVAVLVVEDDPDNLDILRALLERHHATVFAASAAPEALQLLAEHPPSIIVSDIGLPGMDGYELMRRLRGTKGAAARIPAIALTAHAGADDRKKALVAGYQAHIAKPVEAGELVATIVSLMGLVDTTPKPAEPSPSAPVPPKREG